MIAGWLSAACYESNLLGMKHFRFPEVLEKLVSKICLPWFDPKPIELQETVGVQALSRTGRQPNAPAAPAAPDEESVQILMAMGFDRDAVLQALRRANNNVQRASNFLLDGQH